MTQPNTHPEPEAADYEAASREANGPEPESPEPESPEVQWPELTNPTGDQLVDRALGLLGSVPGSPVSEHGELYAGIHDSLLEALDAEPGLPAIPKPNGSEGDS
ncbi:hypothetical protein [Paenarthrobacter aurescens]|uniref:hypothetical protein n=1 Tax=Paenarthrobacter aurescens TaxID=43663 RepID=UPI0021BE1093|nr:hypothetical protein [Paenarthrobacter aurescens]MCT9871672.1 hypothetical protein [Paenarthrobacter aurescens]